jgi:uncharacterized membrane protein
MRQQGQDRKKKKDCKDQTGQTRLQGRKRQDKKAGKNRKHSKGSLNGRGLTYCLFLFHYVFAVLLLLQYLVLALLALLSCFSVFTPLAFFLAALFSLYCPYFLT